jgi:hypothetical protein
MKHLWPLLAGVFSMGVVLAVPVVFAQDGSSAADQQVHPDGLGVCGEPAESWHPGVIDGCAAGSEHGDQPPQWIGDAGYVLSFHGDFNTSALRTRPSTPR